MDVQHARELNRRLCEAWFVLVGMAPGPMPRLVGVRIDEAREAVGIVRGANAYGLAAGGNRFAITLGDKEIQWLFAAALLVGQSGTVPGRGIGLVDSWLHRSRSNAT